MLNQITSWFAELFRKVFVALWDFISDAFIFVLDLLLQAVAAIVTAIPLPDFLAHGMTALFGNIGSDIAYLLSQAGFVPAVALIGAGYTFRLARKLVTLGQW